MVINDTLSDPLTISSGVPQGDIIDPNKLLTYINDINSKIDVKNDMNFTADSTKIFSESNISLHFTL